jgi:hypothetical protein
VLWKTCWATQWELKGNLRGTHWELKGNIVGTHWELGENDPKILPPHLNTIIIRIPKVAKGNKDSYSEQYKDKNSYDSSSPS